MNARERFTSVMHYQQRDRCPIMDFGFWDETLVLWQEQGLPDKINADDFFGMDPQWRSVAINPGLNPAFDFAILEDRGDSELVRDTDGVIKVRGKFLGSIPTHIDHILKDRVSWTGQFVSRLDGTDPTRYPPDWNAQLKDLLQPDRDYPLGINVGSLYGSIRDWMGVDNLSLLVYDDPGLFEEMVSTIADCIVASITPALEAGVQFEFAQFWEDMCYRSGPLLSPKMFERVLVPHYRRISSLLKGYGADIVLVDCDGDISKLLPLWLDCGVNCMFPIEVGVWGADPVKMRSQYGRELRMIGGVGKRILASSPEAITREVERLACLVDDGGYIPLPDHRVPPDVSLSNYLHYLREARRVWGKDLSNLRPMHECAPAFAQTAPMSAAGLRSGGESMDLS